MSFQVQRFLIIILKCDRLLCFTSIGLSIKSNFNFIIDYQFDVSTLPFLVFKTSIIRILRLLKCFIRFWFQVDFQFLRFLNLKFQNILNEILVLFVVSIRAQENLEPNFSAPFYALVKDLLHYTPELSDFDQSELIPSVPSKFFFQNVNFQWVGHWISMMVTFLNIGARR